MTKLTAELRTLMADWDIPPGYLDVAATFSVGMCRERELVLFHRGYPVHYADLTPAQFVALKLLT